MLWKFELRKMFRVNRGIFIIVIFLIAELALLILGDAPANTDAALYREQYLTELEKVEGPWTSEKAALLESEARDTAGSSEGFNVLYKQYLYVNEGKENRYFLDANGWAGLLANRTLDIPLAAAIILLCVPIYCSEAVSGMEPLALTSRDGKRLFLHQKLILALSVTAVLSLSADLVRLAFFALKYGLPHGSYPMQSVESLGSAAKAMSLWSAETLAVGIRLLGSMELAMITLFFSALCGQFALSAFLGTAVAILPWIGLDKSIQYALPLPSSLITAVGFIQGSEYEEDAITGQSVAVFQEAGWKQIGLVVAGVALVGVVCVLFILKRYQTALSGGRRGKRKYVALCLLLSLCLTLGGCTEMLSADSDTTIYNSRDHQIYEYNGLTIRAKNSELIVTGNSGNSIPLIRNALNAISGTAYSTNFYASGRYVYFWKMDSESYGQKLASDTGKTYITALVCVNLDTFDSEVVFEDVIQHTVLGVDIPVNDSLGFLGGNGDFFVDSNYIYYLRSGIRRVELRTGKVSVLDIPTNHNVAFDGRTIYYIASDGILTCYDAETGETADVYGEAVNDFRLTTDGLIITTLAGKETAINADSWP